MIALSPHSRILVATEPVDFRKGIAGLKFVCRSRLGREPDSGEVFVFRNRRMTSVKILAYDGQGFWLMLKRLSRGRFPHWPESNAPGTAVDYREIGLVVNAAGRGADFAPDWKKVS